MWILADIYDGRSTMLNQNLQRILITWGGAYIIMPGEKYSVKNCRHAIGRKEARRGKHQFGNLSLGKFLGGLYFLHMFFYVF